MGNGKSKGTGVGDRQPGTCVIEVVKSENLPNMDIGSLTDAYVQLSIKNSSKEMICDSKLRTLTCMNSLDPVFHSYQAVPFVPHDSDIIFFEIIDEDVSNDDEIGHIEVPFSELKEKTSMTVEIQMSTSKRSKSNSPSTLSFRLVRCGPAPAVAQEKQLFAIRHGESKWNQSQSSKNLKGLVSQYDHELTSAGIDQAVSFNARWKACRDLRDSGEEMDPRDRSDIDAFLAAQAVFASPLTRATQTALLTCEDHPRLLPTEADAGAVNMTLLRNIREVKNVGSFDTVGSQMGEGIVAHVKEMLSRDLGEERAGKVLPAALVVDFNDAVGPWWTPLEVKESHDDVRLRFNELWSYLRYGTDAETIILVGHSHFFRFMMKEYMSEAFKAREPEWTRQLSSGKLDNGACIRVTVAWECAADPMAPPAVNSGRLVFGSKLIIEEEKKSGSARSMLSGIMSGKRQEEDSSSPTAAGAAETRQAVEVSASAEASAAAVTA